jgi:hypothetical protein
MVLGFNHNVMYKNEVFHVQTEDSGAKNPHIITLLYRGGVILCSKKTSYADIVGVDNLDTIVEELMKEQHKEMMRRLKSGEFDDRAFSIEAQLIENYEIPTLAPEKEPEAKIQSNAVADLFASVAPAQPAPKPASPAKSDISLLFELPGQKDASPAATSKAADEPSKDVVSLDDAILSFFGANDK